MTIVVDQGPATLTILPTYRCTAACEQCCFGSNPHIEERLSLEEMKEAITQAHRAFEALQVVVFSGGECTMLGEDLNSAISYANSLGLASRIVTNGHWGAGKKRAAAMSRDFVSAGLKEVNFSTGRDHEQFVPIASVLNAALATVEAGIFTLITVEADTPESNVHQRIVETDEFKQLVDLGGAKFRIQTNSWMAFNEQHKPRAMGGRKVAKSTPCQQVFNNLVVTPHNNISSCCGLTFEHIPELRIGNVSDNGLEAAHREQLNDFMKIWIRVDGPDGIVNKVFDGDPPHGLISADHYCETCALMFKNQEVRERVRERYQEFMPDVMVRFAMQRSAERSVIQVQRNQQH